MDEEHRPPRHGVVHARPGVLDEVEGHGEVDVVGLHGDVDDHRREGDDGELDELARGEARAGAGQGGADGAAVLVEAAEHDDCCIVSVVVVRFEHASLEERREEKRRRTGIVDMQQCEDGTPHYDDDQHRPRVVQLIRASEHRRDHVPASLDHVMQRHLQNRDSPAEQHVHQHLASVLGLRLIEDRVLGVQGISEAFGEAAEGSGESQGDREAQEDLDVAETVADPPLGPVVVGPDDGVDDGQEIHDVADEDDAAGGDVLDVVEGAQREVGDQNAQHGEHGEGDGVDWIDRNGRCLHTRRDEHWRCVGVLHLENERREG